RGTRPERRPRTERGHEERRRTGWDVSKGSGWRSKTSERAEQQARNPDKAPDYSFGMRGAAGWKGARFVQQHEVEGEVRPYRKFPLKRHGLPSGSQVRE